MKISQLFLGLVACSTAFAYAGIDGISSNESNIKIGAAANASHPGGVAAVSVQAAGAPYNAFTGFSSLKGLATANGTAGVDNSGVVQGQFFGANASALAGIAQFDNVSYNTAFGGAKN
ncbi:hypothetical protein [Acinetobacter baumannii]|uniref:hypothetical protein n=1 Tax=Acinetobacter baumannii TaxID=470 RepID=UPI002551B9B7|nr:hypothetical protein [Acinetobacter baumannii]